MNKTKWLIENEWLIGPVIHLHINSKMASPRNSSLSLCRILSRTTQKKCLLRKNIQTCHTFTLLGTYVKFKTVFSQKKNTEFVLLIQINYVFSASVVSCHVIDIAEIVVSKVLCSNVNIAPCLFNLVYEVLWQLHHQQHQQNI